MLPATNTQAPVHQGVEPAAGPIRHSPGKVHSRSRRIVVQRWACGRVRASLSNPADKSSGAMKLPLESRRFLMFVDDVYEDLELWYPKLRLIEAGAEVIVAGPKTGAKYSGKHGYPCLADATISDMRSEDFDAVVIPGGFAPDRLRRDPHVLALVREFAAASKLVAAICHGGWIPISADVYRGVRVTGSLGIKDDLVNAGAIWEDAAVVVDRHFVSSRKPDDLPEFCRAMLHFLVEGPREAER
jgi:protease I